MTAIPQDIMAAATELVSLWQGADVVTVAAGILAERERCAAVADAERVLPLYVNQSEASAADVSYDMAIDHVIAAIKGA